MGRLTIILAICGSVALASRSGTEAVPCYIWNASESVPIGLYRLQPTQGLTVAELVAVRPPEPLSSFLDLNGYLPTGVPMLKRVLALPGQTVCRNGFALSVDNIEMGLARERDTRGRPLPVWRGCRLIAPDEVFLMNRQSAGSLDGRYFGPLPASAVIGEALPVWTERD
ncbi:S26 family signal peptidase [Bradyrhizobium sp. CIAT3101]|uniref:S26 family signal peptidase n=1 Tax=unclassified Bradyrhizobium TaxID=2631580 RepID=UPI00077C9923|nr:MULTISPECIES: S26 family signal peptidase [unclassified Bradyrhizobium]KYH01560.1 conjugal transfer protein TraF [Bradyrhizobium sp. DOA1]WFU80618.1 S26 family signal peptidase [Bradyrhizobium sp. CIAT3101]